MENQHRKIAGYRELSQEEIDLMNRIKAFGPELDKLCTDLEMLQVLKGNEYAANAEPTEEETAEWQRACNAEPAKWLISGKHSLQLGLMCLTRSVAQPGFF